MFCLSSVRFEDILDSPLRVCQHLASFVYNGNQPQRQQVGRTGRTPVSVIPGSPKYTDSLHITKVGGGVHDM